MQGMEGRERERETERGETAVFVFTKHGDALARCCRTVISQSSVMPAQGAVTVRFLPSALSVNVMRLNQARVSGGSECDSLKAASGLAI